MIKILWCIFMPLLAWGTFTWLAMLVFTWDWPLYMRDWTDYNRGAWWIMYLVIVILFAENTYEF